MMMSSEKKRVAAYCRVSTDKADQQNSFESQKRFFYRYIEENPMWELYEIYADEGITGTSVKKRKDFQRMMADAFEKKFDLILTKEISRFARNILDSIYYTRELKRLGIGVLFLNDHLDTRDGDAELRLAILSSIAQEESRRTSERVKWGQKRRMEDGVVFGHSLLGYDVRDGHLFVEEAGAETVRLIFYQYTEEGKGASVIARELSNMGIFPKNAERWNASVILRILKNEKYCGDLIQKKTVTSDYLSHEKKYNRGEEDFVILRDHHTPIISREQFDKAQAILAARKGDRLSSKYSKKYPLSGKLRCGICGASLVARVQERKNGVYHLWRCANGHAISVRNEDMTEMLRMVLCEYADEGNIVKGAVMKQLSALFETDGNLIQHENMRKKLLELYLLGTIPKSEFLEARDKFCKEEAIESEKAARLQAFSLAIDSMIKGEDILFFREILARIVVNETECEVRLNGSARIYFFIIEKHGRFHRIVLNRIQPPKENDGLLLKKKN